MILAEHLLSYQHTTMLLVCDRLRSRFFYGQDREVQEVDAMLNDRRSLESDHSKQAGGEHMVEPRDEQYHDREAGVFYKTLADRLFELKKQRPYEHLILVVPEDDKNLLADALHEDVRKTLEVTLPKLLTNVDDHELMERVDACRRA